VEQVPVSDDEHRSDSPDSDENGLFYAALWDDEDEQETPWNDTMRVQQAVEKIRAGYEARARPLRAIQRRNGGVRLPALVELERERDAEVQALLRAHQQAAAYARAAREQASGRAQIRAQERQRGQQSLAAFARELPGGSRRYGSPIETGRSVWETWVW
jgi:ABC-type nitrate/sulfonate/bicarbonate transport system substrate-binding protein